MPSRDELMTALRNADAAGDVEAATRIAGMIQAAPPPTPFVFSGEKPLTIDTEDLGTALKTGIATTGTKLVRAVGSLLPETSPLKKYVPPEEDVETLKRSTAQSLPATAAALGTEIAATAIPATRAAGLVSKVLPQATRAATAIEAAYKAPIYATATRMAGQGAAAGGAGAATMGEDIGEGALWGAALGPVLGGLGNAAKGAYNIGKGAFASAEQQLESYLQKTFGTKAPEVSARLKVLRATVPGERLTAEQVATAVGPYGALPEIKAITAALRAGKGAGSWADIDLTNQAAREASLARVAYPGRQYGGELSEAESLRKQVTDPLYRMANRDRIELTPELEALLQGPEIQGAARRAGLSFGQAQTGAEVAGRSVPVGTVPGTPGRMAPDRLVAQTGPGQQVYGPAQPFMPQATTQNISQLQRLKNELTHDINAIPKNAQGQALDEAGRVRLAQLNEARNQLNQEMRGGSGAYGVATDIFRNYSMPLNRAKVADVLAQALRKPGGAGERAGTFLGAIENAPTTIRKAGGAQRFNTLEEMFAGAPEELTALRGVQSSLERQSAFEALPGARGIAPKFVSGAEQLEKVIPNFLSRLATAGKKVLSTVGRATDEEVEVALNNVMQDPTKLANVLDRLSPEQAQRVSKALPIILGTIGAQ